MNAPLDYRHTMMRDMTGGIRRMMRPANPLLLGLLAAASIYLFAVGHKGALAFALISFGTGLALTLWRRHGIGVPLMPMIAVQHLLLYGLPILANHETMDRYSDDLVEQAGIEILLFLVCLSVGWFTALQVFRSSFPVSHAFVEYHRGGAKKLRWICLALLLATTGYEILSRLGLLDPLVALLPAGSTSILWDLISAAATCGFFIGALLIGSGDLPGWSRGLFWFIVVFNCYVAASAFLLSATAAYLISVAIGLFWSTGKPPWRFVLIAGLILSFFNLGKEAMRDRYWHTGSGANTIPDFTLAEMPDRYAEWAGVSLNLITGNQRKIEDGWRAQMGDAAARQASQSILDRINNLENLLFVINAEQRYKIEPIHGASYSLIPALLIPRILDPQKPRSHQGQVLLNVHFGRQDLAATEDTYIAWGLLPEAYGNFGPGAGAIILGLVLGLAFGWLEKWTANKLVISTEGFVTFTLFLGLANSYEMVSSTLVTSIFQAMVPVAAATVPFVQRTVVGPPAPPPAPGPDDGPTDADAEAGGDPATGEPDETP